MSEITEVYEPSSCKGDKPTWKGQVVLKVPAWDETLEFSEANMDLMPKAEGDEQEQKSNVKLMRNMLIWSYKFYKKVDLVRLSDGKKVDSLELLKCIKDGQPVLQDCATKLIHGFELGN